MFTFRRRRGAVHSFCLKGAQKLCTVPRWVLEMFSETKCLRFDVDAVRCTDSGCVSVEKEACPLGLAPTSSTTATLAMGDALSIALLEKRGFNEDDFALSHPGGALGKRLLLRVDDIMHTENEIPKVLENATLGEALIEMSAKGLGVTTITNKNNEFLGIFTDGDLRRALDSGIDFKLSKIKDVMTKNAKTIVTNSLAASALALMETHSINALVVVDEEEILRGILNMHDLLRARVI